MYVYYALRRELIPASKGEKKQEKKKEKTYDSWQQGN